MKEKRNKFSLGTKYKGRDMRSRLEARTAYLLDKLGINWKYEPEKILLSNGDFYLPDFYLPKQKVWIECKGDLQDPSIKKPKELCRDNKETDKDEVILLSQEKGKMLGMHTKSTQLLEDETIHLIKCSNCDSFSFTPNTGTYNCRECGYHNGDHDIVIKNIFRPWSAHPSLDLNSTEKIDQFIQSVK